MDKYLKIVKIKKERSYKKLWKSFHKGAILKKNSHLFWEKDKKTSYLKIITRLALIIFVVLCKIAYGQ